jgi:hypothetical protein
MLREYWEQAKSLGLWVRSLGATSGREHIFIVGVPRSGTTLLKTILTAHPALAGTDYESTGLFKLRNFYGYNLGETEDGSIRAACEEASDLIAFYDRVADILLEHYEGAYFVDKIWPRKYRLKYVAAKFPQTRWVHIIRDGRDAYCSAQNHPHIPQSKSLQRFARYWQQSNRLVERVVPDEKRIQVRYEDLVSHPKQEIPRIMSFLDIEADDTQLHPAAAGALPSIHEREVHQKLTQPLNTTSVDRHDDELTRVEKRRFTAIAEGGLATYGYV